MNEKSAEALARVAYQFEGFAGNAYDAARAIEKLIDAKLDARSAPSPVAAPPEVSGGMREGMPEVLPSGAKAIAGYSVSGWERRGSRMYWDGGIIGNQILNECIDWSTVSPGPRPPEVKPPPDAGRPGDAELTDAYFTAINPGQHDIDFFGLRAVADYCIKWERSRANPSPSPDSLGLTGEEWNALDEVVERGNGKLATVTHELAQSALRKLTAQAGSEGNAALSKTETVGGGKCTNCDGQGRIICSWCSGRGSGARPSPETSKPPKCCEAPGDPLTDEEFEREVRGEGWRPVKLGEPAPSPLLVLSWMRWALDHGYRRGAVFGMPDQAVSPPAPEPSTEDERIVDALVARRTAGARETRLVPETGDGEGDEGTAKRLWAMLRDGYPIGSFPSCETPNSLGFWVRAVRFVRAESDARVRELDARLLDARRAVEHQCNRLIEEAEKLEAAESRIASLESANAELTAKLAAWEPAVRAATEWRAADIDPSTPDAEGRPLLDALADAVDAIPEGMRPGKLVTP